MSYLEENHHEQFELGPYWVSITRDGDEAIARATDQECQGVWEEKFDARTMPRHGIMLKIADWAHPLFNDWAMKASGLRWPHLQPPFKEAA